MKRILTALALMAAMMSGSALAQGNVITSYSAFLSSNDHYNSSGARLTQPWQIIRQDRANFHRFNLRDDWDDWDGLFANANNRAKLEQLVQQAGFSAGDRSLIVNNEIFVNVTVYGYGDTITGVWVEVP